MKSLLKARVHYLLLAPYIPTTIYGDVVLEPPKPKDSPYFFKLDIQFTTLPDQEIFIQERKIQIHSQILDKKVWIAQCEYTLPLPVNTDFITKKQDINRILRKTLLAKIGYSGDLIEEYSILLLQTSTQSPEQYIHHYANSIARFLRATDDVPTPDQVKMILRSRVRYGKNDITVIDWEGALLISDVNDFKSEIELLKVGNFQLLRYRMLDAEIQMNLELLREVLSRRLRWFFRNQQTLITLIQNRLQILIDFEWTDQSLLLIGDWYSAQLYRLIVDEFYINHWKEIVSAKLESLNTINETIRDNLSISWTRILDFIQIGGWMILLVGYFFLYYLDIIRSR